MNRLFKWLDNHPKAVLAFYVFVMFFCLNGVLLTEGIVKTLNTIFTIIMAFYVVTQIVIMQKSRKGK